MFDRSCRDQGVGETNAALSTDSTCALRHDPVDRDLPKWRKEGAHADQTMVRMSETAWRFVRRLEGVGVCSFADVTPDEVHAFVRAPLSNGQLPMIHTQHARRTAVRVVFRTLRRLGRQVGDPTLDVQVDPRGYRVARPLTDEEVTLCRLTALGVPGRSDSLRSTAWALGEAGAVSSEITAVRLKDLDDPAEPRAVSLPGTRRVRPRVVQLTSWGQKVLGQRARALREAGAPNHTLLAYGGAAPPGGAKAQAAVCNALRVVLVGAGLAAEADVRPASLRHWAGRDAYERGLSLPQVARLLGHRSLDATAEDIALDWAETSTTDRTEPTSWESDL